MIGACQIKDIAPTRIRYAEYLTRICIDYVRKGIVCIAIKGPQATGAGGKQSQYAAHAYEPKIVVGDSQAAARAVALKSILEHKSSAIIDAIQSYVQECE
jgi:hypothetical protein